MGRKHEIPSRRRKSALQPAGAANHRSQLPVPPNEWIALPAIPVPALVSEEIFALAQARLEGNKRMASRNNTKYQYLLRGLVSCGQCKMACSARTSFAKYNYYLCSLRSNPLRSRPGAKPEERCKARFARADELDKVVWKDVCEVLMNPALIAAELKRAQAGEWLPQAIQARRKTLHEAVAYLERKEAALLDVYLAEVIGREEFVRKRAELEQMSNGLKEELRELEAQAQQQLNVAKLAEGTKAFCERIHPTLEHLSFAQRRQLVELIIDRVVISDGQVEIRYVIPTSPKGEQVPFCYLHKDYRARPPLYKTASKSRYGLLVIRHNMANTARIRSN